MSKKKKFKIRTKRKATASSEEAIGSPDGKAVGSVADRLLSHVKVEDHPDIRDRHLALLGQVRPVDQPICSNLELMMTLEEEIDRELATKFEEFGSEIGFQVTRVSTQPLDNATFSVPEARKTAIVYRQAKVSGIGFVRFCPAPIPETGESGLAMDLVMIVGGPEARQKIDERFRKVRRPDTVDRSPMVWHTSNDREQVRSRLKAMFGAPLSRLPGDDPFGEERISGGKGASPGHRALLTYMCRSQVPLKKALFVAGAGKPIVIAAMGQVEHKLKERCTEAPEILHRDEAVHFLFAELRRMGQDRTTVPFVKLS